MRIAFIMAVAAGLCQSQTRFEVASVKPSPTPPTHFAYTMNDNTVDLGAISLKILLQIAYRMEPYQITAPDWMAATRFDVLAKMPSGANKTQIPEMLQALLAERFMMATHREAREQQVYALATGKNGPALKEGASDNSHPDMAKFMAGRRLLSKISTDDGFWTITQVDGRRMFDAPRITMPELARTLMPYAEGEPVIDVTGLKGVYQVSLEVPMPTRDGPAGPAGMAPDPLGGVSIFSSVQKLGLALEHRKMPVEHLVVDRAEKVPTEN